MLTIYLPIMIALSTKFRALLVMVNFFSTRLFLFVLGILVSYFVFFVQPLNHETKVNRSPNILRWFESSKRRKVDFDWYFLCVLFSINCPLGYSIYSSCVFVLFCLSFLWIDTLCVLLYILRNHSTCFHQSLTPLGSSLVRTCLHY